MQPAARRGRPSARGRLALAAATFCCATAACTEPPAKLQEVSGAVEAGPLALEFGEVRTLETAQQTVVGSPGTELEFAL